MAEKNFPEWDLTDRVIGSAVEVHRELGSGFLEAVYEAALANELTRRGVTFVRQAPLNVYYKGDLVGVYFADILVEGRLLCELKALRVLTTDHEAQLYHYLAATGIQVGLLLNFGAARLEVKRRIRTRQQLPGVQPDAPAGPPD